MAIDEEPQWYNRLLCITLHNPTQAERLIAFEFQKSLTEIPRTECIRRAVERWVRDNTD